MTLADWGIRVRLQRAVVAPAQSQARAKPGAADLQRENARLRTEIASLRAAGAPAPGPSGATAVGTSERLRVLMNLRKSQMSMVVGLLSGSRLDEHFVELFGLSPEEAQKLQAGLDAAQKRLHDAMRAHARVERDGDKVTIKVPPLEEGPAIYDQTTSAIQDVLGPERMAAFSALEADQLAAEMNNFGAEARTLSITRQPDPAGDGRVLYSLTDYKKTANGGYGTSNSTALGPAQIRQFSGPLGDLLPADF